MREGRVHLRLLPLAGSSSGLAFRPTPASKAEVISVSVGLKALASAMAQEMQ